jgi:hypothetical protein
MCLSRKTLLASLVFIVLFVSSPAVTKADPIVLFNTGVINQGTLAPGGSVDAHYTVLVPNALNFAVAFVTSSIPGVYLPNGPNSQFIAPAANANQNFPDGNYTYRTTFVMTGLDPSTAVITGQLASDNATIAILLNGQSIGPIPSSSFTAFTPFSINSGFVAGLNTLDFVVNNAFNNGLTNPTAFRVELSGTAAAIPEPTTMLLLGSGLAGVAVKLRRRHKAGKGEAS